jgi:uncharacterized protein
MEGPLQNSSESPQPRSPQEDSRQQLSSTRLPQSPFADTTGIWPVWRILVYVSAYYVLRWLLLVIAGELASNLAENVSPLWLLLLEESLLLIAAIAPAVFFSKLEGRSFGAYGLPASGAFGKQFWSGVLWGLAAITLLLIAMRAVGVFHFGALAVYGFRIIKFGVFWAVFFLVVGLYEDFLFRGYTLFTLSQTISFWPAALLISVIFGLIHLWNHGENWIGALGAACIGLFFCLTLRRTGSLWFAIGMHASWDWGESFLYSVPDSGTIAPGHLMRSSLHGRPWLTGGSVGPEASILVFVLIALMWLVFDRIYPARKQT